LLAIDGIEPHEQVGLLGSRRGDCYYRCRDQDKVPRTLMADIV
jgi:hypothetical protein